MRRTVSSLVSRLVILLLFVSATGTVWAQEKAWNQEEVAVLASQMSEEVKRMRIAVRKEPQIISAGNPTKQRTGKVYLEKLRMLKAATAKLTRQLSAGETRDQTLSTARRIDSLLRDVRQQAAKLHSTVWTDQHLDPALGLAAQLRAYYGIEIPPPSEAGGDETVAE
ncbi:MAG: hypothetical protein VX252_03980 [Myxococcota bacterium]|nr:hypothetical protein [Myxococcota bacterium]